MPTKHKTSWRHRNRSKATPAELVLIRAKDAAHRQRQRYRVRFAAIYGRRPTTPQDEKILRRMLRGHPILCACYDCAWDTGEQDYTPRVARVVG